MLKEHLTFRAVDGTSRAAVLEGPYGGPCVVLCHGHWTGKDNNTNLALTKSLNAAGIMTFRFDFKGHGKSDGVAEECTVTDAILDLDEAWRKLVSRNDVDLGRVGVFGSSFGGMIAGIFVAQNPLCKAGALKAPVADEALQYRRKLSRKLGLPEADVLKQWEAAGTIEFSNGAVRRMPYAYYVEATKHSLLRSAPEIECPMLLVQGTRDESVPPEDTERVYALLRCEKKLKLFDADHKFSDPNAFDDMIREVAGFFKKALL